MVYSIEMSVNARLRSAGGRIARRDRHAARCAIAIAAGVAAMLLLAVLPAHARAETVAAAVLRVEHPRPLPISRLDLPPADLGLAGARLATEDNATTGRFMGQEFTLEEVTAPPEEAVAALEALLGRGVHFVATLADADTTLALADAAGGPGADPERARARRPAARRRLPGEPAAPRPEPRDARPMRWRSSWR